jgi:hypothetical protein
MPKYTINGVVFNSATSLSDADLEELAATTKQKERLPAQTGTAAPESMVADPSNPFSFLGQEQQTEQGPAMQAVGQGVNRALQVGAGAAKGAVINPVAAAAQVVGGETGRQFAQEAQKSYETQRANAGATGFDWAELAGSIISPVNRFLPGGTGGRAALGGAAGAAMTPVLGEDLTMSDVLAGKVEQMGLGAVAGRLVGGVANALTPTLKAGVRELMDKGIPVTPGQAYEGIPGVLYRQIEKLDLPFMRVDKDAINLAFTKSTGDDVLNIVGEKLPANMKNGQQIFGYIQNKLTNFYDNALEKIGTVARDGEFNDALKSVQAQVADTLDNKKLSTGFKNFITANIDRRAKDGTLTGKDLKSLEEIFRKKIDSIKATDTPAEVLKAGYDDAYKAIKALILRNDKAGDITKANLAYMQRSRIMEATQKNAAELGGTAGTYSPAELAKVAAKQGGDIEAAMGTAPLQAEATKALNIVGDTTPEAAKFRTLMIAGKLTGLGALGFFSPLIAGPILVASGLTYGAAKKLMQDPGATRKAVSEALMSNPSLFGVVPSNVREQLKEMQ